MWALRTSLPYALYLQLGIDSLGPQDASPYPHRLSTAELASETKNQFADHIDLRTVSKPEPLTPKTEVASSSGPTGSYGLLLRPELHIGCWQTAREHKMGVSGRSAGSLLRLGVLCAHAAHGSG